MRRPLSSAQLVLCLAGALLGSSTVALAQSPDPQRATAAQALFDQANEELENKRFATACPKLEEVTKLVPEALGARMALAECYEGLGKLAGAWSQYAMVEALAAKANQTDRAATAGRRAGELKPKLATLTIDLASGVDSISGLTIRRGGLEVGKAQWGIASPVDVGTLEILVAAPGYKPWKKSVEILADGAKASLKVPMLVVDPTAGARRGVAPGGEAVRPWQKPLAIGAMAAGGVSLAVGAVLGGLAIAKNHESNESACSANNQCTKAGLEMRDEALAMGTGSTVTFIAGGVLAAGGLALFLTAPSGPKDEAAPKAGLAATRLGLTPGGLRIEGTW